jgi:hypothetical protein
MPKKQAKPVKKLQGKLVANYADGAVVKESPLGKLSCNCRDFKVNDRCQHIWDTERDRLQDRLADVEQAEGERSARSTVTTANKPLPDAKWAEVENDDYFRITDTERFQAQLAKFRAERGHAMSYADPKAAFYFRPSTNFASGLLTSVMLRVAAYEREGALQILEQALAIASPVNWRETVLAQFKALLEYNRGPIGVGNRTLGNEFTAERQQNATNKTSV